MNTGLVFVIGARFLNRLPNRTYQNAFVDLWKPGAVVYGGIPSGDFFNAKVGNSFKCVAAEDIPFKAYDFKFEFGHLKVQPFVENGKFGEGELPT